MKKFSIVANMSLLFGIFFIILMIGRSLDVTTRWDHMSYNAEDAHRTDGSLRQEEVLCVFSAHTSSPSSKHFARKFTEKDSLTGTRTGKI
ncbi:hypothetical protein SDJN03_07458, partial [Cucurbita argyrosperma subsp. sororia]